jgi:hypothetical protein
VATVGRAVSLGGTAGSYEVTFWRRPLTAMTEAIYRAGFVIERLVEPPHEPELRRLDPESYRLIATQPRFLFFRLKPTSPGTLA